MLAVETLSKIQNRFYPNGDRYLNLITLQSKALDQDGVPEETIVIEHPSNELLSRQQVRQLYWSKRWTHRLVEHIVIDAANRHNEF